MLAKLVILSVLLSSQLAWAFLSCPSGGLRICTASDVPFSINSTFGLNYTVSNCIYQNCPQILIQSVNGENVTFSNVTFVRGNTTLNTVSGGAISVQSNVCRVFIINCKFSEMIERSSMGGAALFVNGTVIIVNSTFTGNTASSDGGAIRIDSHFGFNCTLCNFFNNSAPRGGAVAIIPSSNRTVTFKSAFRHCTFSGNRASILDGTGVSKGGTFELLPYANLLLDGCFISNSFTFQSGGGISFATKSFVEINNCTFTNCVANNGGAIHVDIGQLASLKVSNSLFFRNSATFAGGGFFSEYDVLITFSNCSFLENIAASGAALHFRCWDTIQPVTIRDCTFVNESCSSRGGSIYMENALVLMDNCAFHNIWGGEEGGAIFATNYVKVFTGSNLRFYNCQSGINGGAFFSESFGIITVTNSYFERCQANIGGALCLTVSSRTIVSGCTFVDNFSTKMGGSLYGDSHMTVSNCSFYRSSSNVGGSISLTGGPFNLQNLQFMDSSSTASGGSLSFISSNSVSVTNATFINSSSGLGGAVYLSGSGVTGTLTNVGFFNCASSQSGGAIYAQSGTLSCWNCMASGCVSNNGAFLFTSSMTANLVNSVLSSIEAKLSGSVLFSTSSVVNFYGGEFTNCTSITGGFATINALSTVNAWSIVIQQASALFGGSFYLIAGSTASCFSCNFTETISQSNGSLIYASDGSSCTLLSCNVDNPPGIETGSFFYLQASVINVNSLTLYYLQSITGTLIDAIEGSQGNFDSVTIAYAVATASSGSIVKADSGSVITISNSIFPFPKASEIFSSCSTGSLLILQNTVIDFSLAPELDGSWATVVNKVAFRAYNFGTISLGSGSSIFNFIGDSVAMADTPGGIFACQNAIVANCSCINSPLTGVEGSLITVSGCSLLNNSATGTFDQCHLSSGVQSFGGAIGSEGAVVVDSGALLQGNNADFGGAIYIDQSGSVTIGEMVNIVENRANVYGGAFYITSNNTDQMIITGDNVKVQGNEAIANPTSSYAYFESGFVDVPIAVMNFTATGSIFVKSSNVASMIKPHSNLLAFSPSLTWFGAAKSLSLVNYQDDSQIRLTMSQDIPLIQVTALDVFNQTALVDPANLVVVQVREVNFNATIAGDFLKAISDRTLAKLTISSLSIPYRTANSLYRLEFSSAQLVASEGTDNGFVYLNILYSDCDAATEAFVESLNACIPIVKINQVIRISLVVICLVFIVGCLFTMAGLHTFRNYHLIKANSFLFLSLPVFGCMLAFMGPVLSSVSCITSTAVENIGFILIFASLIAKLYRIKVLFRRTADSFITKKTIRSLKEFSLLKYVMGAVLFIILYEVLWSIFSDPAPENTLVPSLKIIISDKCRLDSNFALVMAAIKFVVSIVVSYLAFINRNAPSDFNEAKYIGFACYNWVIFGTFISLTAQFIISNPDISFLVKGVSLICSHAYTTLYLATYKVFRCWKYPEESKLRHVTKLMSSEIGTSPQKKTATSSVKSNAGAAKGEVISAHSNKLQSEY